MKKIFALIAWLCLIPVTHASDLLEIYQKAEQSDPVYKQAIAEWLFEQESVPIARANLLPHFSALVSSGFTNNPSIPSKSLSMELNLNQTIFDIAQFAAYREAQIVSKQADAKLNAVTQSLITRTASAYFAVLNAEENVYYNITSKKAFRKQLDQVRQKYEVGLKTLTDVYIAKASYDEAEASFVAAEITLNNARENLRVITSKFYTNLLTLNDDFPLSPPNPKNVDQWVKVARHQNWNIKVAEYEVNKALQDIKLQSAGHYPTLNLTGKLSENSIPILNATPGNNTTITAPGSTKGISKVVNINLNIPIFTGGLVSAKTKQARYAYQLATYKLEEAIRNTINATRKRYLGIITGISKIKADKQAIKSNLSSLYGMEISYKAGLTTLVDVLNQRQRLFESQRIYTNDRYDMINNILYLKQAAGTLSFKDLLAINTWLVENKKLVS